MRRMIIGASVLLDGRHAESLLGWQGSAPSSTLLSHLRCSVDLGIYLLCPLKGLGDKLLGYVPRQNSHFFLTWNLSLVFYLLLVSLRILVFEHPFLRYLTLAIPVMNLLTPLLTSGSCSSHLSLPAPSGIHLGCAFPSTSSAPARYFSQFLQNLQVQYFTYHLRIRN